MLRSFSVFFVAVLTTGCMTWRAQPVTPEVAMAQRKSGDIRLELKDGRHIVLESPQVDGQDIIGVGKPGGERVRLPLSDIQTIWMRELDKKRTAILGGALATVGIVAFIFRNDLNLGLGWQGIF
jgi:hypothetical protein